ncbi:hypothetical protein ACSNOI_46245, partial [Actinomadura kijaniata]|uniref:hypothetical protein n=1 Tax=Actinomadura kijaniata TaxID=46161 RepID=UPI003F1E468C
RAFKGWAKHGFETSMSETLMALPVRKVEVLPHEGLVYDVAAADGQAFFAGTGAFLTQSSRVRGDGMLFLLQPGERNLKAPPRWMWKRVVDDLGRLFRVEYPHPDPDVVHDALMAVPEPEAV